MSQEHTAERDALGGMRIATVGLIVRAGQEQWSQVETEIELEVEPGWPDYIALAATVGALKSALRAVEEQYELAQARAESREQAEEEPEQ